MPQELFKDLAQLDQVEALVLGGSRAGQHFDQDSDYDVYVYLTAPLAPEIRRSILSKHCSYMEIGNHFWELEDDCVLKNGIEMELIYRRLDDFDQDLETVVLSHQAQNAYTTCMWYNLLHSKILYDRHGRYAALQSKYSLPYPTELKKNIIAKQLLLLDQALPAFSRQIKKPSNVRTSSASTTGAASFSPLTLTCSLPSIPNPIPAKSACSSMLWTTAPGCPKILKALSKTTSELSISPTASRKPLQAWIKS
ncbi:hypothetical protein STRDD11_01539 [Streptococcus sp. DD11]|nr:hypothetical protein STRDD11_01539 [Streptococcus sp. DD11]